MQYITGDQPVVNTHSINSGLLDEPTEFEIYYPISPKKAVMITMNDNRFASDTVFVTIEDVKLYNSYIIDRSHEQIFSNSESLLEELTYKKPESVTE